MGGNQLNLPHRFTDKRAHVITLQSQCAREEASLQRAISTATSLYSRNYYQQRLNALRQRCGSQPRPAPAPYIVNTPQGPTVDGRVQPLEQGGTCGVREAALVRQIATATNSYYRSQLQAQLASLQARCTPRRQDGTVAFHWLPAVYVSWGTRHDLIPGVRVRLARPPLSQWLEYGRLH